MAAWDHYIFEPAPEQESEPVPPVTANPADAPYLDHAHSILANNQSLDDHQRADLWDAYHQSRDANEFASKVASYDAPREVKHALWQAKQATAPTPAPNPVDKVAFAIARMSQMDATTLELAENHPVIATALIDAATKDSQQG